MRKTFFMLLLILVSNNIFSQSIKKEVKGEFHPIVAQQNTFEQEKGKLILSGYQKSDELTLPYSFEWRKGRTDGELISKGVVKDNYSASNNLVERGTISNLEKGIYFLITYDSSEMIKYHLKKFEIK